MTSSEFYGLDFGALTNMAGAYGLEPDQNFFEKLAVFEAEVLRIWRNERPGRCAAKQKAVCEYRFGLFLSWACEQCDRK